MGAYYGGGIVMCIVTELHFKDFMLKYDLDFINVALAIDSLSSVEIVINKTII